VKSTDNNNINTLAKKYCRYRYQYCCKKVLTIPIPIQTILFCTHSAITCAFKRGANRLSPPLSSAWQST